MKKKFFKRVFVPALAAVTAATALTGCTFGFASDIKSV